MKSLNLSHLFLIALLWVNLVFAQGPKRPELVILSPVSGQPIRSDTLVLKGTASPNALVQVKNMSTQADAKGLWEVRMPSPTKPGRYHIPVLASLENMSAEASVSFEKMPADPLPPALSLTPSVSAVDTLQDSVDLTIAAPTSGAYVKGAVFLPIAPGVSPERLRGMMNRFKKEMASAAQGIALQFVSVDSLVGRNQYQKASECRDFECAIDFGRLNSLDLVFIGRLERRGVGHRLEISALSILRGATLASTSTDVGANLGELESRRPQMAKDLVKVIETTWSLEGVSQPKATELYSGTPISESVMSGVLSRDKSPYIVYGTLQVPAGEQLLIESGVTVYFAPGQYGGIQVYGQLVAEGTPDAPIRFLSAAKQPNPWDWNRILLVGNGRSTLSYVQVAHANFGIHVENSSLTMRHSHLFSNSLRGLYVRNGQAEIQDSRFENGHIVALQVGALADVRLTRSTISENRNGVAVMKQGRLEIASSEIVRNDRGIVLMPDASLITQKNRIAQNQIGISTVDAVSGSLFDGLRGNGSNIQQVMESTFEQVLAEPTIREVDRVEGHVAAAAILGEKREEEQWSLYGNVQTGAGYAQVKTARNNSSTPIATMIDTVAPGAKFTNSFSPEGLFADGSAYVLLESTQGRGFEFQSDVRSDDWTRARVKPFTLRYWSDLQTITVGHFQENASPLMLSGMDILGLRYKLSLGQNDAQSSIFSVDGFFGETQEPLGLGDRNPDLFGQYIQDGGAVAQQLTAFGRMTVSPWSNFRLQAGALFNSDRKTNLLVRDDIGASVETQEPIVEARNFFAAMEWINARGTFQFNADIAMGRADSADALAQAALDQIFVEAGIDPVDISTVRWLFKGNAQIQGADSAQVYSILADTLDLQVARDSLVALMSRVENRQEVLDEDRASERVLGLAWNKEHMAGRLEMVWRLPSTSIHTYAQYSGTDYLSPGSLGLLQNGREYGVSLTRSLFDTWDLEADYSLVVENAATDSSHNILGFSEGTTWGIGQDPDWENNHLMDANRAKFTHLASIRNQFRVGDHLEATLDYEWEQSTQRLPSTLKANYDALTAVYLDPWFQVQSGQPTQDLDLGDGQLAQVDSLRWTNYENLASANALAEGLLEKTMVHALSAGLQWRRSQYTLKVGGNWTWQLDQSSFKTDSLLQRMTLADSTIAKLGRHPQASTWFEHSYPMSLTTRVGAISNRMTFTPRFRQSEMNDQQEKEWSLGDRFEIGFAKRKYLLSLEGNLMRCVIESFGAEPETQTDLNLLFTARANWTSRFYTELIFTGTESRRPDNLEEEYRLLSGKAKLFYAF